MRSKKTTTSGVRFGWEGGRFHDGGLSGITGVPGQPGYGKSYLVQKMIRTARRVLFFDPVFQVGSGERGNALPGAVVLRDIPSLIRFWKKNGNGAFRIVYQPTLYPEKQLDMICTLLREVRDTVFCIDELPLFCSASWTPEPLALFARAGRHYGITLLWTAQRPADVSRLIRSVTNQWRVFRLQDSLDVDALRGRVPAEALVQVPTLPKWTHIAVDDAGNWEVVRP